MAKAAAKKAGGLWDTLKTIFWALVIAGVFRTVLFQPFSIPSGSMKPELLIGDYLFVTKYAYGYSRYSLPFEPDLFDGRILASLPERGDVAVFKHPKHDTCSRGPVERIGGFLLSVVGVVQPNAGDCRDYIKRVIGLPGDEIRVRAGILQINGEAVRTVPMEDYVEPNIALGSPPRRPRCTNAPVPPGGPCRKQQFRETLPNGESHRILNVRGEMGVAGRFSGNSPDDTQAYVVPEGHVFMMGDNRDNSVDSRFLNEVGYVPLENLIGRADLIAISSQGAFWQIWNWRFSRLLTAID